MTYDAKRLATLGIRHQRLRDELAELKPQLRAAIRAAYEGGVRQVDIVKVTGYTRELVRRICRDAPDRPDAI